MTTEGEVSARPSISSVDARVGRLEEAQSRLEARQLEQDGVMRLIQLEQTHIREIMTARFVSLETHMSEHGTKLDNFIGKIDALIAEGMKQQADLEASPLGRQIEKRLAGVESWEQVSRTFHAEVQGMTKVVTAMFGTSVASLLIAGFAIAKTLGWV